MSGLRTPAAEAKLAIDLKRLWSTIERSAQIGPGVKGGLRRLAASDHDKQVRDQLAEWCREAGLELRIDKLGNMFALRKGRYGALAPVAIGSHLDSQYAGGRYDGVLGVMAGLEVMRTLNDNGIETKRPLCLINWTNEEGARFSPPIACSGAFAGVHEPDWVMSRTDDDGKTLGGELRRIGYSGPSTVTGHRLESYLELHIEQGPVLDAEKVPVGIVTGGYKVYGVQVDFRGATAHSGPTPMGKRRDALVAAARCVAAVNDIGWRYQATGGKATAPRLVAWPNKPGILAEWAQVNLDVRHADAAKAAQMRDEMLAAILQAAAKANVESEILSRWEFGSERFDPEMIDTVRAAARKLGVATRDLVSEAGHDAYSVSRMAPTAMIFTPCKDGISHNEAEHVDPEAAEPAVNVLLHAVLARANR